MRTFLSGWVVAAALAAPCAVFAQGGAGSVGDRVAAQNALFEEQFQADLKRDPERETAYGDYRYNDQLTDVSLAAARSANAADAGYLDRLKAVPTAGMPEQDVLSHQLMQRLLEQRATRYAMKEYEMPLNQMGGVHTELADLPLSVPLDSVKHYEDYVSRLHQAPRVFAETTEVLRAGMADHLMPVRFLLEKVPAQCDGIVKADPFLGPTKKYPAGISEADQRRLTAAITDAVETEVLPAYARFAAFVRTAYAPNGRTTLAVTSLPDGQRRYAEAIYARTTTRMSAKEIHEIGLKEIARIEGEMTAVAKRAGYKDLQSFRASIKDDATYVPRSGEAILEDYRRYEGQMQPKLPLLFGTVPKQPLTVEAIPAFQAAMATHYMTGTPDGKRPGRVVVATSDYEHRSLIEDEATAYHEGLPGHHMQLSVQQQLEGLPKFRLHTGFTAFVEGWALYSEQLGKEVGFYQDPVSDYGRLHSELFRAVRLVVDTGIHDQGWTRDEVVDFFRKSESSPEPEIQSETDRYIAWPAQALAYKLGHLKIREMRGRAERELGTRFDVRRFHDEVLNGGALPLDLFEARMDGWIAGEKGRSTGSVGAPVQRSGW